jgi:ABC-2 type transport system permease protein
MSTTTTFDPSTRLEPRFGGFSFTMLGIELKRMLRNRRTVFFALLFPVIMFFVFSNQKYGNNPIGSGNIAAFILINMAFYGAALTTASIGSMVAVERAQGWSRQLRLTPLNPSVYIAVKTLVALVMGGVVVTLVNVIGVVAGKAHMPAHVWIASAVLSAVVTVTFAALGVFIGYIVPGENAMQILGPGLAILSFLGGVFIPLSQYNSVMLHIAYWTPMYGPSEIARSPLTSELPWYAVVNAVVWLAIFIAGAAWRMSKDTARV